jgi:hypothetical protein
MKRATSRTVFSSDMPSAPPANYPPVEAIRSQLDRMSRSRIFTTSPRLTRFLRFAVEQALAGRPGLLKEYIIGVEVFERTESFDPRVDAIVRVEARRLRSKITQYYSNEGNQDPIVILFERGSYAPKILRRHEADAYLSSLVPSCMQEPLPESEKKHFVNSSNQDKLEKWLRFVLSATQSAIWNLDTATGKMIWSAEATHMFGIDGPAATLDRFLSTVHENDRAVLSELVEQAGEGNNPFELLLRFDSPQLRNKPILVTASPAGSPKQVIGMVRFTSPD